MATSFSLTLSLCLLLMFNICFAQLGQQMQSQGQHKQQQRRRFLSQSECRLENLNALQPSRRVESEAGLTEYWDQYEDQLQCAGVAVVRHTIGTQGLLLPSFSNSPKLVFVVRGHGIESTAIPGCPETYQSESQSQSQYRIRGDQGQSFRDQHQKVRTFREGDIITVPAGVVHWIYNRGQSDVVLITLIDTSNDANQLDQNLRKFYLAGSREQVEEGGGESGGRRQRGSQGGQRGNNIFNGFDDDILAESFGIDRQLVRQLKGENDRRDRIVRVDQDLEVLIPERREEEEERRQGRAANGLEETFCTARLKYNIGDARHAHLFNPRGGRINTVNSLNLPILRFLRLSAERGVLYSNAIVAPHYNLNSHSVIYVTRGNGRVQIADNYGRNVFDGQLEEGQLLVVPQNFVVIKRAGDRGFEWIAFKTNDNAITSPLAGRVSAIRSLPEEVLMNSYSISREEARRLKYNREELTVFSPGSRSRGRY